MRLRNVKNKDEILNASEYLVKNPEEYIFKKDIKKLSRIKIQNMIKIIGYYIIQEAD